MRNATEQRYIESLDRPDFEDEVKGQGFPAEEVVVNFFNQSGFETRFSTKSEDEGRQDIGPKQIIDAIPYFKGRPVMGLQITTSADRGFRDRKLKEMRQKPFLRLPEMNSKDLAIPRVLIYLDAKQVSNFLKEPNFSQHPEIAIQIIDSAILSLKFDFAQTKNPQEQLAVSQLIQTLEQEKRKYIH